MDTTQDVLQNRWLELKDPVKQQWDKLTADDLAKLSGKRAELVSVLQQRYGHGKAQAEMEIANWLHDYDKTHATTTATNT